MNVSDLNLMLGLLYISTAESIASLDLVISSFLYEPTFLAIISCKFAIMRG